MGVRGESVDWKAMYMSVVDGTVVDVLIPEGVTRIRASAFRMMSAMESCVLPSTLTTIQNDAFNSASKLKSIVIPSSVTSIGSNAFNLYNSSCEYFILEGTTPPTLINSNAFYNTNNCPIYVPDSAVNDYKAAAQWSNLASRIFPMSDLET